MTCPGCGAQAQFVRGAWETVHEDDCDWFHGPDPTAAQAQFDALADAVAALMLAVKSLENRVGDLERENPPRRRPIY